MKRFVTATALACILSISTLAGDMPTGGAPVPPPGGSPQTTTSTSPGDTSSDGSEGITDVALSALLTVLGLLSA